MTVLPAPAGTGIRIRRTDLPGQPEVPALAEYVTSTARSTTLALGEAQAITVEHLLSALTGLGVDNALVELDGCEVPILNGSAAPYAKAFGTGGLEDQGVPRAYLDLPQAVEVHDERSGGWVRVEPATTPSADITVEFPILGVQQAHWDEGTDYATELAPCRTFVLYRDIEALLKGGLIKGGDLDNALVITEDGGYLNNPQLHFPDECGRHKLLDLLGDLRLAGGHLNARISAYKPGHTLNTQAAQAIRALLQL